LKNESNQRVRAHYIALSQLDCDTLWDHATAFDQATPADRLKTVSVIRAVAVVFAQTGTSKQKDMARRWIRSLLEDSSEKIRRYAVQALPKLGADHHDEKALLSLWERPTSEREQRAVTRTLERVGGIQTIQRTGSCESLDARPAQQRLKANVARSSGSGKLALEAPLTDFSGTRLLLECRSGLETILHEEVSEHAICRSNFEATLATPQRHPLNSDSGGVELLAQKPFDLTQLLDLRCWSNLVFPLARLPALPHQGAPLPIEELVQAAASAEAFALLKAFTSGTIRYRWEFPARRINGSLAKRLAEAVHTQRPELLNDPREALWELRVSETPKMVAVDLVPKFRPDPRFAYRRGDVPAASHPPLAAAIARIARVGSPPFHGTERIWDPFCGSGLELAECVLQNAPAHVLGTDLDPDACRVTTANVASALSGIQRNPAPMTETRFECSDFRDVQQLGIPDQSLTLIVTNPPLGKRVPQRSLHELMHSLFALAVRLLAPSGRLVLVNPCRNWTPPTGLSLVSRQTVNLGFAHFPLEKYVREKTSSSPSPRPANPSPLSAPAPVRSHPRRGAHKAGFSNRDHSENAPFSRFQARDRSRGQSR
jgi:23S rRNA G2445 N2-methylase RlmL